jgi:hypothetical protein
MRDTLESLPFEYEYTDVSCSSADAVAGVASSDRGSVRFLIVGSSERDLGCDVPVPKDKRTTEGLTMAFATGRGRGTGVAELTETIDCAIYKRASGEDECGV